MTRQGGIDREDQAKRGMAEHFAPVEKDTGRRFQELPTRFSCRHIAAVEINARQAWRQTAVVSVAPVGIHPGSIQRFSTEHNLPRTTMCFEQDAVEKSIFRDESIKRSCDLIHGLGTNDQPIRCGSSSRCFADRCVMVVDDVQVRHGTESLTHEMERLATTRLSMPAVDALLPLAELACRPKRGQSSLQNR